MKITKSIDTVGMWNATTYFKGDFIVSCGSSQIEALDEIFDKLYWLMGLEKPEVLIHEQDLIDLQEQEEKDKEDRVVVPHSEAKEDENICSCCGGNGYIEIMGDGENFEWDVIGTKPCPECQYD